MFCSIGRIADYDQIRLDVADKACALDRCERQVEPSGNWISLNRERVAFLYAVVSYIAFPFRSLLLLLL